MIAGYCWPQSVLPGGCIDVCCSGSAARFRVEVVRPGLRDEIGHSARNVIDGFLG